MPLKISSLLSVTTITSGEKEWKFMMPFIVKELGFQQFLYPPTQDPCYSDGIGNLLVIFYLWDEASTFSKPPKATPNLGKFSKRDNGYRYHVPVILRTAIAFSALEKKEFFISSLRDGLVAILDRAGIQSPSIQRKKYLCDFDVFSEAYRALPLPTA